MAQRPSSQSGHRAFALKLTGSCNLNPVPQLPTGASLAPRPRTPVHRASGSGSASEAREIREVRELDSGSKCDNGRLTSVISSALDYKRFLDRRKQMIQQQVDSAQAGSQDNEGGDGPREEQNRADGNVAARELLHFQGSVATRKVHVKPSIRSSRGGACGGSGSAAGICGGDSGAKATRSGANSAPCPDSSDMGSASTLPAGAARQACRSFGHAATGDIEKRDTLNSPPAGTVARARGEIEGESRRRRDSSVEGFSADIGDFRASLCGGSLDDYVVGKQVGQGAYATVFLGIHKETGRKVAIKMYEKYKLADAQRRKSVSCEIKLMERMRHPNIVVFYDSLDTQKQIYIIMEFVGGGSLHHFLKKRPGRRLDDQCAKRTFFQVCQGLKYLHDRRIAHRDVKLENLLLEESGTVKIIDFGFSTILPQGKKLKIFCGTPSYMAPEIVTRKEYTGFCADVWAMGVLLHALLCGSFPFKGQNDRELYRKIVRGVFNVSDVVSECARQLLVRILTQDMNRRPAIDEVLADAWFSLHKDDLYGRGACSYHNISTSSTATTTAPSSTAGQSAAEGGDATGPRVSSASSAFCAFSGVGSGVGATLASRVHGAASRSVGTGSSGWVASPGTVEALSGMPLATHGSNSQIDGAAAITSDVHAAKSKDRAFVARHRAFAAMDVELVGCSESQSAVDHRQLGVI